MRASLVLAGLLAATAASAAECRQEHAIYADRDEGYELAFEPVGSDAAVTTHHFKLKVLASNTVLDGIVMPGDPARSNGMVMHDCPEGDSTGEEIAACTVWEGVIYALDGGDANHPVTVQIGPVIIGSAIRDALPFVNFQDFTNQIDFADAGKALTALALAGIAPVAATIKDGSKIRFTGALSVTSKSDPIKVTPVALEVVS